MIGAIISARKMRRLSFSNSSMQARHRSFLRSARPRFGWRAIFFRDSFEAPPNLARRPFRLLGNVRNMPPSPLPDGVAAFEYAPFSEVLPRACAIVHQGGVGTTGQAMRSGKPVLVVPHAHDQFDNGARVERLGCARVLPRPRYNAESATRELKALLDDSKYAESAT